MSLNILPSLWRHLEGVAGGNFCPVCSWSAQNKSNLINTYRESKELFVIHLLWAFMSYLQLKHIPKLIMDRVPFFWGIPSNTTGVDHGFYWNKCLESEVKLLGNGNLKVNIRSCTERITVNVVSATKVFKTHWNEISYGQTY